MRTMKNIAIYENIVIEINGHFWQQSKHKFYSANIENPLEKIIKHKMNNNYSFDLLPSLKSKRYSFSFKLCVRTHTYQPTVVRCQNITIANNVIILWINLLIYTFHCSILVVVVSMGFHVYVCSCYFFSSKSDG